MTLASLQPDAALDIDHRIRLHARAQPYAPALQDRLRSVTWGELDHRINRIANAFFDSDLKPGDRVAFLGANSLAYLEMMLGAIRAGICVVPLSPLASVQARAAMFNDSKSRMLFVSQPYEAEMRHALQDVDPDKVKIQGLSVAGIVRFTGAASAVPPPLVDEPQRGFNLIYSSGTTGIPKGIVQSRAYRAREAKSLEHFFGAEARTIVSTPLYSNTTLFLLFAVLAVGGSAVIMEKFDALTWLEVAQASRATDVVLVPVQYVRLLDQQDFDRFDLDSLRNKFCTSAPLRADLKRRILERWPAGGLTEFYGMTEGGVSCVLHAHEHPDKLDTVGQPSADCDLRILDDDGTVLPPGKVGEIVGRSPKMMDGYFNQDAATEAASWRDEQGRRFQRSGDVGWLDEDGFVHLIDRKKDVIISGGFNIYAADIEAVLDAHPCVRESAVVGAPSYLWGETPVAFVALRDGADPEQVRAWVNDRLGKAQRVAEVVAMDELPRSPIGKILKRELRDGLSQRP